MRTEATLDFQVRSNPTPVPAEERARILANPGFGKVFTDHLVSINELADLVARIAGKTIRRTHDLTKPQGVRGRNSDNTRLRQVLGWEPCISLKQGLETTYKWIESEVIKAGRAPMPSAATTV